MQLKNKPGPKAAPIIDRLNKYINKTDGCWEWVGCKNEYGYGKLLVAKKGALAHRLMWAEVNGAIPAGLCVLHRCDNPGCVNPDHLFIGTHAENMKDMWGKGRHSVALAFLQSGPKGERNTNAKLTGADVMNIRDCALTKSTKSLAKIHGVSTASIRNIISRRTWSHIK